MPAVKERIYQPSDLAGTGRKTFIADAMKSRARLRGTDGESLVMLREARLDHVAAIRDYAIAYLTLDVALRRPRTDRRPSDFGEWAFISVFDDDDIDEFRQEINDAIVRSASGEDHGIVESLLDEWRTSAQTVSDSVAVEILGGTVDESDWLEVGE